uniref:G-protein coupled receptors family 1 profile domain-containing protein n=1 Tax=Magallana gigas TaxID=29159 RepID=A0A8W8M7S6_MAGGI
MHLSCSATLKHDHFSPTFTSLVIAGLAIIFVADLVGNTLVIIVILKNPSMRDRTHTTNFFLLNLTIADLLVALVIPFSIHSAYKECWDMPMFLCKINSFLVTLSLLTSIHTLMYISIHKFVGVSRVAIKNEFSVPVSRKTLCIMIVAAWMYALVFSIMTVISDPIYKEMTLQCGPRYPVVGDETFYLHIANQIGNLFIPLVILMFCYTRVFMYIRHHANEQRRFSSTSSDGDTSQSERGVTLTMVIVLACFLLSWLPYIVYTNYGTIVEGEKKDIPYYLNPLAFCFGFMNSACNPLIYALRFPNFRQGYFQQIQVLCHIRYIYMYNILNIIADGGRKVRRPVIPSMVESEAGRRTSAPLASISEVRISSVSDVWVSSTESPSVSEIGNVKAIASLP